MESIEHGAAPRGPYSHAVRAGGLIYLSGIVAEDESGVVTPGEIADQTALVLVRAAALLQAAGSSLADVVAVTAYLRSAADFAPMNDAYRRFWREDPPTRTTVVAELVHAHARLEMAIVAAPAGTGRVVIHPDGWLVSPNPYSYAIRSGDAVFLSGLVPRRGRDNRPVTGDLVVQTRALMENARELLAAAGLTFAEVVTARVYLTDTASFHAMNQVYREYFADGFPARATIKAGLVGDFLVEMTFMASTLPRQIIGDPPPGVPISPAVRAGQRLYLSGALGNTPDTAGDVAAQTRETLARLGRTLALASASPADVVDAVIYIDRPESAPIVDAAYRSFFGSRLPARTMVATPLVAADGLVEIMFTAVAP